MKIRLFLTGSPSSGKTALLIRALSDLRVISGGYAIVKLTGDTADQISPGLVDSREAAACSLPYSVFSDCIYSPEIFAKRYSGFIEDVRIKGMGYLDPILGEELRDSFHAVELEDMLFSGIPLCGVIASEEYAGDSVRYTELLKRLTEDEDTVILNTDVLSSADALSQMRQWAEEILDARRHAKFDPLMKLRAKRKRPDTIPPEFRQG